MPPKNEQNPFIDKRKLTKSVTDSVIFRDIKFMKKALHQARRAMAIDEVPIGAVIVKEGKVIARGHNLRESKADPTAHAEIVAIRKAAKKIGNWRLDDCTLYVTIEPCPMCMGAMINARLPRLVYGADDPKAGAAGTLYDLNEGKLNHTCEITKGVLAEECGGIISGYFSAKRAAAKEKKALKKAMEESEKQQQE